MSLAAINLISELKCYDVRPLLLSGLVALLRPTKEEVKQHQIMEGGTSVFICVAFFKSEVRLIQFSDPFRPISDK